MKNSFLAEIELDVLRQCSALTKTSCMHYMQSQALAKVSLKHNIESSVLYIHLFQLRLSPKQSGKVEYERERMLGIDNRFIHLLAIPSSLSRTNSTFPLCLGDNLN